MVDSEEQSGIEIGNGVSTISTYYLLNLSLALFQKGFQLEITYRT